MFVIIRTAHYAAEHAVDEASRLLRPEGLRYLDGLGYCDVDGDFLRYRALVERERYDGLVERDEALGTPFALHVDADDVFYLGRVRAHAAKKVRRVGHDLVLLRFGEREVEGRDERKFSLRGLFILFGPELAVEERYGLVDREFLQHLRDRRPGPHVVHIYELQRDFARSVAQLRFSGHYQKIIS